MATYTTQQEATAVWLQRQYLMDVQEARARLDAAGKAYSDDVDAAVARRDLALHNNGIDPDDMREIGERYEQRKKQP